MRETQINIEEDLRQELKEDDETREVNFKLDTESSESDSSQSSDARKKPKPQVV